MKKLTKEEWKNLEPGFHWVLIPNEIKPTIIEHEAGVFWVLGHDLDFSPNEIIICDYIAKVEVPEIVAGYTRPSDPKRKE
jgi:hypothetical protein